MNAGKFRLLRASGRMTTCCTLRQRALSTMHHRVGTSSIRESKSGYLKGHAGALQHQERNKISALPQLRFSRSFRSSVITAGLKNGIVGLPNVGKVCQCAASVGHDGAFVAYAGTESFAEPYTPCFLRRSPPCSTRFVRMVKLKQLIFHFAQLSQMLESLQSQIRVWTLSQKWSSLKRTVPTSVEFVDIAGLVKGASKGEGLGNQFLANIRECDSLVQVVRCFEDPDVVHVAGKVDPVEDTEVINFELALSDITQIEKRLEKMKKGRAPKPEEKKANEIEAAALAKILEALEQGIPARAVELTEEEAALGTSVPLFVLPDILGIYICCQMLVKLIKTMFQKYHGSLIE